MVVEREADKRVLKQQNDTNSSKQILSEDDKQFTIENSNLSANGLSTSPAGESLRYANAGDKQDGTISCMESSSPSAGGILRDGNEGNEVDRINPTSENEGNKQLDTDLRDRNKALQKQQDSTGDSSKDGNEADMENNTNLPKQKTDGEKIECSKNRSMLCSSLPPEESLNDRNGADKQGSNSSSNKKVFSNDNQLVDCKHQHTENSNFSAGKIFKGENKGNLKVQMKNVLLLGTARAGKYTVAKHMAGDKEDFPKKYQYNGVGTVHNIRFGEYNFILIDTNGIQSDDQKVMGIDTMCKQIMNIFKSGMPLILLVVRKDCSPPEELESLASIVETMFTVKTRKYTVLIHSGCENLKVESRVRYITEFAIDSGHAGRLHSLCGQIVLTVGLPNLAESSETYIDIHRESIRVSAEYLRGLSMPKQQSISDMFTQNNFPTNERAFSKRKPCKIM